MHSVASQEFLYLVSLRNIIASNQDNIQNFNTVFSQFLAVEIKSIVEYVQNIEMVSKNMFGMVMESKFSEIELKSINLFKKNEHGQFVKQKIILYFWQIVNFYIVKNGVYPVIQSNILIKVLQNIINYQFCHSSLSIKHAQICIFNMISLFQSEIGQFETQKSIIIRFLIILLSYHIHSKENEYNKIQSKFQSPKNEKQRLDELQWLGYIFQLLFQLKYYEKANLSIIQDLNVSDEAIYDFLHLLGNYLQQIVDKRSTTELVRGYECQINDIKEMYNSKQKPLVEIKISEADLTFLCQNLLKNHIEMYKAHANKYISKKIVKQSYDQDKIIKVQELITEIFHILNNVLFLGGYNNKLQDHVIKYLLEQNDKLLQYLELSFLLYKNIESTKYNSKISLMVEMEKQNKIKLFQNLNIEANIQVIDIKSLKLDLLLSKGQLVNILRLLTNLVHINHRAQVPFEQNIKYLHMILSLSHDSVSQITMKQWAIMFIRNVSEWSEILRTQIGKIQMEIKVDQ